MNTSFAPSRHSQHGMATLFITLVTLLIAGLVLLYTSRGAITEQRLSANEIREKQAFAAASAGIDQALSYLLLSQGMDHDGNNAADVLTSVSLLNTNTSPNGAGTNVYYTVKYCSPDSAAPLPASGVTCPTTHTGALPNCTDPVANGYPHDAMVVSCGWSDDDTAVHRVTQRIVGTPSLAGDIPNPLISRGAANLLVGGGTVMNYFSDLTIWSGGSTLGQSNTGKSFIRDSNNATYANPISTLDANNNGTYDYRDTGNSPACLNPPAAYTCSTQGSSMGHDVIMADTTLTQGSADDFFAMFFGSQPADYRDNSAGWKVDLNNAITNENSTNINTIYNVNNQPPYQNVWIEGTATIDGAIGSIDRPVILVVNGTLNLGANAVINGIVFSTGDTNANGTPVIYGSLITGGNANTVGNIKVIYDPYEGKDPDKLGTPTKLQGSWKDW